jgi:2-amino-4-hydroxy-6-hydroxymethyldihydropteridine diphosphokinase
LTTAYVGLGSNLGDRCGILREAVERIRGLDGVEHVRPSHLYETRPWGLVDQPDFINAVAEIATDLTPHRLLEALQEIERVSGREQGVKWGPRILDLDLLDCGGEVIDEPSLSLPHPRIAERAFVLVPLCEIAPGWHDPLTGRTSVEMLEALDPDPEEVRLVERFAEPGEDRRGDAVRSDLLDD